MTDDGLQGASARKGRFTRLFMIWLVLPLIAGTLLIAAGVHLAAHHRDAWYTALVRWIANL